MKWEKESENDYEDEDDYEDEEQSPLGHAHSPAEKPARRHPQSLRCPC